MDSALSVGIMAEEERGCGGRAGHRGVHTHTRVRATKASRLLFNYRCREMWRWDVSTVLSLSITDPVHTNSHALHAGPAPPPPIFFNLGSNADGWLVRLGVLVADWFSIKNRHTFLGPVLFSFSDFLHDWALTGVCVCVCVHGVCARVRVCVWEQCSFCFLLKIRSPTIFRNRKENTGGVFIEHRSIRSGCYCSPW